MAQLVSGAASPGKVGDLGDDVIVHDVTGDDVTVNDVTVDDVTVDTATVDDDTVDDVIERF